MRGWAVFLPVLLTLLFSGLPVSARDAPRPVLTTVVLSDYPPFFGQDRQGRPTGFGVEIMERLAGAMGHDLRFKVVTSWGQALEALARKDADIAPGLAPTEERMASCDFTGPLLRTNLVLLQRISDKNRDPINQGSRIGLIRGGLANTLLDSRPGPAIRIYEGLSSAMFDLQTGDLDAVAGSETELISLARRAGIEDHVRVVTPPLLTYWRHIGVRKGDPVLLAALDDALGHFLVSEEYPLLLEKWYPKRPPFWTVTRVTLGLGALCLLGLAFMSLWHYLTLKKVNRTLERYALERYRAAEALKASQRNVRSLVDNLPLGLASVDGQFRLLTVNPSFCQLFGMSPEELVDKKCHQVIRRRDEPCAVCKVREAMDTGQTVEVESEDPGPEGGQRYLRKCFSPLYAENGTAAGASILLEDTTEKRRAAQLREDVERMVRHDLKSPLMGITGIPEFLLSEAGNLTPTQYKLIQAMGQAGYDMLNMINLSTELFKMERGTYAFEPLPVDLAQVLDKVLTSLNSLAKARKLSLKVTNALPSSGAESGFTIPGEPLLCYTMLANLVKNALEASPEGGTVDIGLEATDLEVRVGIHNLGEVPAALRPVFFDKYSTQGKRHGSGLGTYSAALMARMHGGAILLDASVPGRTTVTVHLPLS